ncbi:MAG: hypothetical protein H0T46_32405 [Deltaproteobacteria bacterium]|nr:hypothetical protein [Deltaproteobacteria bacterium]
MIAFAIAVLVAAPVAAAPTAKTRERVAVIDLGPADDGAVRRRLAGVVVAAGLEAVIGDNVEDALAAVSADGDAVILAAAMVEAQRAFGALDCVGATTAAKLAIGTSAARQAAGLSVPELPRALTYVLLCADRAGDTDVALQVAQWLRIAGGSSEVPKDVWAKYPEIDAALDRDTFPLEIVTDVPGAEIWIDFRRAGVSPLKTFVAAGDHVIGAGKGTKRGWGQGKAVKTQTRLHIPTTDQAAPSSEIAARVASWKGALPAPAELAAVLAMVDARVALIRRGNSLEAWGHVGASEPPRRLGSEDGVGTLAEADRLIALIKDRVQTWNDRAPDPDQPLLVEDPKDRKRKGKAEEPARWWVYAALIGAAAIGGTVLYLHDTAENTQRVELNYP